MTGSDNMSTTTQAKKSSKGTGLREIRSELKRVTWPTRAELINYTGIVVATCIFFAITMGLVDAVFHYILKMFIG